MDEYLRMKYRMALPIADEILFNNMLLEFTSSEKGI